MFPLIDAIHHCLTQEQSEGDEKWRKDHQKQEPRLFCSSIGHCPRRAFIDAVQAKPEHPFFQYKERDFNPYTLDIMAQGNTEEDRTWSYLSTAMHEDFKRNVAVGNNVWTGHIDFLYHDTIIEHKSTGELNFVRSGGLPYSFHCMQTLLYQHLYLKENPDAAMNSEAILFYRNRGHYAQFDVVDEGEQIGYEGNIDGKLTSGQFDINFTEARLMMEDHWLSQVLPNTYETPMSHKYACTRQDKRKVAWADCPYFTSCWSTWELNSDGSVAKRDEDGYFLTY